MYEMNMFRELEVKTFFPAQVFVVKLFPEHDLLHTTH